MANVLRRVLARMPTYLADARHDPQWLLMFAFGRFIPVRNLLWPTGSEDSVSADHLDSLFSMSRPDVLKSLAAEGIYAGLNLPAETVAEIKAFAQGECYANFDRRYAFLPSEYREAAQGLGRPILTGHYLERIEDCDAVRRIRADPLVNGLAESYLATKPKPISTRLWWSFPTDRANEQDLHHASMGKMHFDLDDWRTLKFFFYLTDVGPEDGAHVYMRRTHRRRLLRHQFTPVVGHDTSKVLAVYGAENALELCGKAGFGFVEDPFAFHMGKVPSRQARLMLEIGFGVSSASPSRRFYGDLILH